MLSAGREEVRAEAREEEAETDLERDVLLVETEKLDKKEEENVDVEELTEIEEMADF